MNNPHQVIVHLANGATKVFASPSPSPFSLASLKQAIHEEFMIPLEIQRITTEGGRSLLNPLPSSSSSPAAIMDPMETEPDQAVSEETIFLEHGQVVCCKFSLFGGKGGFGSMLRSQGGRMASKVTTNIGACRDLSGRRLKTLEDAKALSDYQRKKAELEAEEEAKINRKIQRALEPEQPAKRKAAEFDPKFIEDTDKLIGRVSDAVSKGFEESQKLQELQKHKEEEEKKVRERAAKKLSRWDVDNFSDDTEEEEEEAPISEEPAKKKLRLEEPEAPKPIQSPSGYHSKSLDKKPSEEEESPKMKQQQEAQPAPKDPSPPKEEESLAPHFDPIDLSLYSSAKELEALGMDHLKHVLQKLGLKCGGSLADRAQRLFLTKNKRLEELPANLFAPKPKAK